MEHFTFETPMRHPRAEDAGRQMGSDLVRHKHTRKRAETRCVSRTIAHGMPLWVFFPSFFLEHAWGAQLLGTHIQRRQDLASREIA